MTSKDWYEDAERLAKTLEQEGWQYAAHSLRRAVRSDKEASRLFGPSVAEEKA